MEVSIHILSIVKLKLTLESKILSNNSFCLNIFLLLTCDNIFIVEEHLFLERTCFLNELSVFLLENIFITFFLSQRFEMDLLRYLFEMILSVSVYIHPTKSLKQLSV